MAIDGDLRQELDEPPDEESLYAEARSNNPALGEQEARVMQADSGVRAAWGEHLPELSVAASYGYRIRDVGGGADEYVVGAYLDWPLFSGLAIDGRVAQARAQRAAVDAGRVALEDQLRVDVRSALASWRTAQAAVASAEATVAVDRAAVEESEALFEGGKATTLDVVVAQADLTRAEAALVEAYSDFAVARAGIERLVGRPL
jgi:outer membrane protein